ncbi:hypothetical protein ACS0PU_007441 [Formica fusca]
MEKVRYLESERSHPGLKVPSTRGNASFQSNANHHSGDVQHGYVRGPGMGFSGSLVVQLSRVQRKLHDETAREPTKLEIDAKRRDDNENLKSKLEKKTKDADSRKEN